MGIQLMNLIYKQLDLVLDTFYPFLTPKLYHKRPTKPNLFIKVKNAK